MIICPKNHSNPDNAQFCRICGFRFEEPSDLPFHLRYPELHLRPISEFETLTFWRNKPEYVENPSEAEDPEYLYIAREGKLGILYWHREKHWYRTINDYHRIIQCEYDRIEKKNDMFVCYKDSERVFVDKKGNILK